MQCAHERNARIARALHPHLAHVCVATKALRQVVEFDHWSNSKLVIIRKGMKVQSVRETEILVEQKPSQGGFVCDHAGPVINRFSTKGGGVARALHPHLAHVCVATNALCENFTMMSKVVVQSKLSSNQLYCHQDPTSFLPVAAETPFAE